MNERIEELKACHEMDRETAWTEYEGEKCYSIAFHNLDDLIKLYDVTEIENQRLQALSTEDTLQLERQSKEIERLRGLLSDAKADLITAGFPDAADKIEQALSKEGK